MITIDRRVEAAKKAWVTIRKKKITDLIRDNRQIEFYAFNKDMRHVSYGTYRIKPPLIKPSKLTYEEKGGIGKELSDGWALNFAIGCTHACRFCYVDSIHKRFTMQRLTLDIIGRSWGMYLLIPENLEEAIKQTPWHKWNGKEVMLSSTHDPYLPELAGYARRILEVSLQEGVRYLIQTRSVLVKKDFDLLARYREQVRLQVSICTLNDDTARVIEPRVSSARARLNILKEAKEHGITTGVIIAPILPVKGWLTDLEDIMRELADIADMVYGESLHIRGGNLSYMEEVGITFADDLADFDKHVGKCFNALLAKYGLKGRYWYEYKP
ncbi:MAG: radical SAM protein [Candidatus Nitrosocaldaceae archaeon]